MRKLRHRGCSKLFQVSYRHTGFLTPWPTTGQPRQGPFLSPLLPSQPPAQVRWGCERLLMGRVGVSVMGKSFSTVSSFKICFQVTWERSNLKRGPKSRGHLLIVPHHKGHTISMGLSEPRAAVPPAWVTTARRWSTAQRLQLSPDSITRWEVLPSLLF